MLESILDLVQEASLMSPKQLCNNLLHKVFNYEPDGLHFNTSVEMPVADLDEL